MGGDDDGQSHVIVIQVISIQRPKPNHHSDYQKREEGHRCASHASTPHLRPALPIASPSDAITGTSSSQIHDVPHSEIQRLPRYRKATNAAGRVSRPMTSRMPRPISVTACIEPPSRRGSRPAPSPTSRSPANG